MWKNSDYRGPGFAHDLLSFQLFYSAASLMTAVLFALPIALFLSLLAAMRASRASAKTFADAGAWLQYAIALIFSAYVVGRGGWIEQLSLPMPVAFIVAFATLAFLARRTRDEPAPDQTVGAGPGRNWWENGVWAAKLSVPLAAVPFLFYAYILLDARLGPAFALHATPELLTVPVWIVNEAIFWIASALVLGWLLAYLPGRNAVLKGLALAGVYAGSVGLGALLLGRTDQHWLFRAFIVVLFYIGVGIRIDLATLKLAGRGWRDLVDASRVGTWRGAAAYAAPALLALIGIASQIYAGHPAQASHDLLQNLTTFIPKPCGGSGT